MSVVTNVILTAHVGPADGSDPEIDSVNRYLQETDVVGTGSSLRCQATRVGRNTWSVGCTYLLLTTRTRRPF